MWSILICDPDTKISEMIKQETSKNYKEYVNNIKVFKDDYSILFYIEDHPKETGVVIIDIDFAGNGIELAQKIKNMRQSTVIIFTSSNTVYNFDIYDVDHVCFLAKPISKEILSRALKKASKKIEEYKKNYIIAVTKTDMSMIPTKQILYMEKEKRKIHITDIKGRTFSFYSSFDEIKDKLDNNFFRCHNSYIINITRIVSVNTKSVLMEGGQVIPVSRTHIKKVRELFLNENESYVINI